MSNRNTKPTAGATVTVACKMPNGVILRGFEMREQEELVMGGGMRTIRTAVETGERYVINGVAREPGKYPLMRNGAGAPIEDKPAHMLDTGYALTHGVPKAFWDRWLEQNKDMPMVKNGLIFAHGQSSSLKSQGKEFEGQKSGLEGVDPNNPGKGIEKADEMKNRKIAA